MKTRTKNNDAEACLPKFTRKKYWYNQYGEKVLIKDMDYAYVFNSLRFLYNNLIAYEYPFCVETATFGRHKNWPSVNKKIFSRDYVFDVYFTLLERGVRLLGEQVRSEKFMEGHTDYILCSNVQALFYMIVSKRGKTLKKSDISYPQDREPIMDSIDSY